MRGKRGRAEAETNRRFDEKRENGGNETKTQQKRVVNGFLVVITAGASGEQ